MCELPQDFEIVGYLSDKYAGLNALENYIEKVKGSPFFEEFMSKVSNALAAYDVEDYLEAGNAMGELMVLLAIDPN